MPDLAVHACAELGGDAALAGDDGRASAAAPTRSCRRATGSDRIGVIKALDER